MRPRGRKAGINTKAGIARVVGRLDRINIAIEKLEAEDMSIFEREKRHRIEAKITALRAEQKDLMSQLAEIKEAINQVLA